VAGNWPSYDVGHDSGVPECVAVGPNLAMRDGEITMKRSAAGTILPTLLAMMATFASPASAEIVRAVEYYHQAFEHYFVTANPAEIAALDSGAVSGWWRTGQRYQVDTVPADGLVPVCRFYTAAYAGKASHFFTASVSECAHVKTMPDWTFEGVAFYARVPDAAGNCAAGTAPISRLYNGGQGGAPNHAYTSDGAKWETLVGAGWISEGVAYCAPLSAADPMAQTKAFAGSTWDFPWALPLDGHDPVIRTQFSSLVEYSWDNYFSAFRLTPPELYIVWAEEGYRYGSDKSQWGVAAWDPFSGSFIVTGDLGLTSFAWTLDEALSSSTPVCTLKGHLNWESRDRNILNRIQPFLWSGCQLGVAVRR